jgi:peptide deformylase
VLLVLGAAGGVGLSAVQIGKVCGAVVIAVARYLHCFCTPSDIIYDNHSFWLLLFWRCL